MRLENLVLACRSKAHRSQFGISSNHRVGHICHQSLRHYCSSYNRMHARHATVLLFRSTREHLLRHRGRFAEGRFVGRNLAVKTGSRSPYDDTAGLATAVLGALRTQPAARVRRTPHDAHMYTCTRSCPAAWSFNNAPAASLPFLATTT